LSTAAPVSAPSTPAPRARSSTVVLLGLTGFGLLMFLGSVALVVYLVYGRSPGVTQGSFLSVKLKPSLTDAPAVGGLYLDPADAPMLLSDVTWAVRQAKDDERIEGLYLQIDGVGVGWAGLQELRTALTDFRGAGKPCVAYAESYTTGTYYLASACDRVALAPSGVGLVTGLAANITYYVGAMEKLGVKAEMLHVGDFKSAVEPYERTGPSEPASEAMNHLLDSLWGQFLAGVAAGRARSAEEVQAWIDTPALAPEAMLERGMVDVLVFPDQLKARVHLVEEEGWTEKLVEPVAETDKEVSERFTSLSDYLTEQRNEASWGDPQIAVVYAEGPIVSGEAEGGLFGDQLLADRTFSRWMKDIREDEEIKAVVLRVNSPGGSGQASDMMWRDIERLKAAGKPVVVSMGDYAASGGYFIAAPADWIVAQPGTITGSIGVFGGKMNLAGTYEKLGLSEYTYKRGEESNLLSATAPFSEKGRVVYQEFLDHFYEVFLNKVSTGRELERDAVHQIAQGRVWTGEQALEHKLVDQLGGLPEALAKAAELAELEDYDVVRWPAQKTLFELMLEDLDGSSSSVRVELPLPGASEEALQDLLLLERILDGAGVAALLPGGLRVE
jgi:protease-4